MQNGYNRQKHHSLFSKEKKQNKKWIELSLYYNASRNSKYVITTLLEGLNVQMLNILKVLVYFHKKEICGKMLQKQQKCEEM